MLCKQNQGETDQVARVVNSSGGGQEEGILMFDRAPRPPATVLF